MVLAVHACTWEVEAEGPEIQGSPQLHGNTSPDRGRVFWWWQCSGTGWQWWLHALWLLKWWVHFKRVNFMINALYGFKKSYENETQAVGRQHSHMCVSGSDPQQPVLTWLVQLGPFPVWQLCLVMSVLGLVPFLLWPFSPVLSGSWLRCLDNRAPEISLWKHFNL